MVFENALLSCNLCPRRCGANRKAGARGFCKAGDKVEVYTCGPHRGEEPPISGSRGSGAVFFSRCTLRCAYCQNYRFSQAGEGGQYSVGELAEMFRGLWKAGCHNWNLVSPTPWLPFILEAIELLKQDGVSLPVVYNTGGFENIETLAALAGRVSVYLPDLRYSRAETAGAMSGADDYVEVSRAAFREMWRQAGPLRLDRDGVALSGMICRLLILPGHAVEAVENLQWLAAVIGEDVAVSVMSQYTPAHKVHGREPWGRGITREEYDLVRGAVADLGFSTGWVQDFGRDTERELMGFNMKPLPREGAPGKR
jgi:putative pyruvate formate lyase activating enzyme